VKEINMDPRVIASFSSSFSQIFYVVFNKTPFGESKRDGKGESNSKIQKARIKFSVFGFQKMSMIGLLTF
jgi:hypothetical protein